jgi:hypothetical protein
VHTNEEELLQYPHQRGYLSDIGGDQTRSESDTDELKKKYHLLDPTHAKGIGEAGWEDEGEVVHIPPETPGWLLASILPSYTEKIDIEPSLSLVERILSSFATYRELKDATLDSHFEGVFTRLQQEWTYVGGLVSARPFCSPFSFVRVDPPFTSL